MNENITEEIVENKLGYEVAIEEMQYQLDEQYKSIGNIKTFVQQIFGAASLIISLIGALQIFGVQVDPAWHGLYNILVGITMFLYIILVANCVRVLAPLRVKGPISADWDILIENFVGHEDDLDVLKQRLRCYLDAISLNKPIIDILYKRVKYLRWMLPAIVIILLILSLIPRTPIP